MSDDRLRVTKSSRSRLNELKRPGETYSDVLARILPEDETVRLRNEEKASISATEEIHDRVFTLAEDGVPAYRVIEYFLYRYEMEQAVAPDELLDTLYNRGTAETNENE